MRATVLGRNLASPSRPRSGSRSTAGTRRDTLTSVMDHNRRHVWPLAYLDAIFDRWSKGGGMHEMGDDRLPASKASTRGVALVETVFVASTLLLLLYGGIQLALVGYSQLSLDGASFLYARLNAIGSPAADKTAQSVFTHAAGGSYQFATGAQSATYGTSYDYQVKDPTQRFGGSSAVLSLPGQSLVQQHGIFYVPFLGNAGQTNLQGASAEPLTYESNPGWDAAGTSSDTLGGQDYFSSKENAPPYFAGVNRLPRCVDSAGNDPPANSSGTEGWQTCPLPIADEEIALGAYLTSDNYGAANPDVSGGNGAFAALMCHYNVYASWGNRLYAAYGFDKPNAYQGYITATAPHYDVGSSTSEQMMDYFSTAQTIGGKTYSGDPDMTKIRSWSVTGDPTVARPLTPLANCP